MRPRRNARCIMTLRGAPWVPTRCPRNAAKRLGDLFLCAGHDLIAAALIDDRLAPQTRRMLAFARWQSVVQAQRLIDRMHGRSLA